MNPPFDSLSDSDSFEQLIFDLLEAEGFSDIVWRGPGPDGGRDIEAAWTTSDPIGGTLRTRWYIECKWYTDSVPFTEIEPKLLAATAARADYLLVATSSRIRNTAMDSAQDWLANRGHPFRIRTWNGRDLLRLTVKHSHIFSRHFPTIPPPQWGSHSSDYAKLQLLANTSIDRLSWRLAPIIQWATNTLSTSTNQNQQVIEELELATYTLRAHELFSSISPQPAAQQPEDIKSIVEFALSCCTRRRLTFSPQLTSCHGNTSYPLLTWAMFELLFNAAQYSENNTPTVTLTVNGPSWQIDIANKTSESPLPSWPVLGYRSPTAKVRNPAGQGLGCWLAATTASHAGANVTWLKAGNDLLARITGAKI